MKILANSILALCVLTAPLAVRAEIPVAQLADIGQSAAFLAGRQSASDDAPAANGTTSRTGL